MVEKTTPICKIYIMIDFFCNICYNKYTQSGVIWVKCCYKGNCAHESVQRQH